MTVLFMGTPHFSVPTLEALINSKHTIEAIATQPDKPRGRGKKVVITPVKEVAISHNIKIYQPKRIKEESFIEELEKLNPDIIVVIAFGQILPKKILEIPKFGCINVHASLLPKYRGAGPIQWSIINGESETGITTMHMDAGLDTGDMILKEKIAIDDEDTFGTLHDKLSQVGAKLLLDTLQLLDDKEAPREKQSDEESTYAPMLEKKTGYIDWSFDAEEIERLIRGLNPWPSAYTYLSGKLLKIWKASIVIDKYKGEHGEVVAIIKNKGLVIKCGRNNLLLSEVQLQGKRRMDTSAFLRGHQVNIGEQVGRTIL